MRYTHDIDLHWLVADRLPIPNLHQLVLAVDDVQRAVNCALSPAACVVPDPIQQHIEPFHLQVEVLARRLPVLPAPFVENGLHVTRYRRPTHVQPGGDVLLCQPGQ